MLSRSHEGNEVTFNDERYEYVSPLRARVVTGMQELVKRLPHFKGRNRIARMWAEFWLPYSKVVLNHVNGGPMVFDIQNPHEIAMYFDYFAPDLSRLLRDILRPRDCFVDCGANVGYFTFLAASLVGQWGKVVAIDPNPYCIERMQATIDVGGYNQVELVNAAVGAEPSEMPFNVATDPMYSSFSDLNQLAFTRTESTVTVQVRRVDDVLAPYLDDPEARIRIMKIDVEGAELEVLQGAQKTMKGKKADYIFLELHPQQLGLRGVDVEAVQRELADLGYRVATSLEHSSVLYEPE